MRSLSRPVLPLYPTIGKLSPRQWSLTARLTFFIIFVVLVLSLSMAASLWYTMSQNRFAELANSRVAAESVGAVLGGFLRDLESTTEALAMGFARQPDPLDQETASPYLTILNSRYEILRAIFLTDPQGRVIASPEGAGIGTDLSQREYVRALQGGQSTVWSSTLSGLETRQATVAFGRVVRSEEDGSVRGFLIAAFYPERLAERVPRDLQPDANLTLVDSKGTVLFSLQRWELSNKTGDLSGVPAIQQALQTNETQVAEMEISGGDTQVGTFVPIPRAGWVVGFTRSQAELDAIILRQFMVQSGVLLGIMGLTAFVFLALARRFAAPLTALTSVASAITRGERPDVPLFDESPELEQLSVAFRTMYKVTQLREDILRASEEELAKREERLRLAMEAGEIGAWEWDVATGAVTWTPNLEAIHGLPPGTFGGTFADVLETVHPEDRSSFSLALDRVINEGQDFEVEYQSIHPDGAARWYAAKAQAVRDDRGNLVRMVGTCTDVTQRKRAEMEQRLLAESTAVLNSSLEFAEVLDALAHLVVPQFADWCVIDIEEKPGKLSRVAVVHSNPELVEQVKRWQELFPYDPNAPQGVPKVMRTGEPEFYPHIPEEMLRQAAPDPERYSIVKALGLESAMVVPLSVRGHTFGAITLVTADSGRRYTVHDLKTAEALSRRTSFAVENARLYTELKKSNEAKDEFLGVISHEVRTPITAIYAAARLLSTRGARFDNETKQSLVNDIEAEAERLSHLVNDLLYLTRLELGERVASEPVSLPRVMEKVSTTIFRNRPKRSLDLKFPEDLPLVAGESGLVEQVLRNLLSNADKYSEPGASIEIQAHPEASEVVVSVLDRGPGLPPEEREHIFERFYRAAHTARKAPGIGIGLTVCKRLVEAQGGRIWALPREDGDGLAVCFTIPVCQMETINDN